MIYFPFSIRWITTSVNSTLSAGLGYKLVWLVLTFNQIPVTHTPISTSQIQAVKPPTIQTSAYDLTSLLSARLFGNPQEKIAETSSSTPTPPKTKLNLTLHGIYYSTRPEDSIAMIATEKGENKLYRENATLPGGSTLYQIHPKEVILLRNDRQETLLLVKNQTSSETSTPSEVPTARNTASPVVEPASIQSPERLLGEYQQQLRTNPQQLRNLLNVTPYSQDGQFIGYRLNTGQNATLMSTFGLQAGDILTEINGVVFDSPLKGLEVAQQLATAEQINATVLRNGQPLSLSFAVGK